MILGPSKVTRILRKFLDSFLQTWRLRSELQLSRIRVFRVEDLYPKLAVRPLFGKVRLESDGSASRVKCSDSHSRVTIKQVPHSRCRSSPRARNVLSVRELVPTAVLQSV